MNPVEERQSLLLKEFSTLESWEERYKRVIAYGKKLAPYDETYRDEKFKVRGCQSQVWLHAGLNASERIVFQADSDSIIVKGLAAILVGVYSDAEPQWVLKASPQFLKDLGFESHLSPSRANGLYSMLRQILYYAQAYQALQNR